MPEDQDRLPGITDTPSGDYMPAPDDVDALAAPQDVERFLEERFKECTAAGAHDLKRHNDDAQGTVILCVR